MSRNSCATRRRASVLMPRPSRYVFVATRLASTLYSLLQPGPRFLNVQQPRHAPSSGTRDQPVDHHDICSSFSNRQQGAHCHDPHGCFASLYDPYELFRHDLCYCQNHPLMRPWRGDTGVARDTQTLSLLLQQLFLRLLYAFSYTFRSSLFPSTAFAILARREDIAL